VTVEVVVLQDRERREHRRVDETQQNSPGVRAERWPRTLVPGDC
jgi:hypothetical protein